jgi:hypothetical protein
MWDFGKKIRCSYWQFMKDARTIKVKFTLCNKQRSVFDLIRMVKQGSRMMAAVAEESWSAHCGSMFKRATGTRRP